jgi:hypothetical protein
MKMNSTKIVVIRGRLYDPADPEDRKQIVQTLVPEFWPGTPDNALDVYMATQEMLLGQFLKALAQNWHGICRVCHERGTDAKPAQTNVSFSFTIDQTAPLVAAIARIRMKYGISFSSVGGPQSHDISQGELDLAKDLAAAEAQPPPPPPADGQGELPDAENPPPESAGGGEVVPLPAQPKTVAKRKHRTKSKPNG